MLIVHGIYRFGKKKVACRNDYCTVCRTPRLALGVRSFPVFHLFFVPLLPLGMHTRWFCLTCHQLVNSKRPTHPGLLIGVVVLGALIVAGSVAAMIQSGDPLTLVFAALGLLFIGLAGFSLWKKNYAAYVKGKALVTPLLADYCPICRGALMPSNQPHCDRCDLDIRR